MAATSKTLGRWLAVSCTSGLQAGRTTTAWREEGNPQSAIARNAR
jgi:hypothetical protein